MKRRKQNTARRKRGASPHPLAAKLREVGFSFPHGKEPDSPPEIGSPEEREWFLRNDEYDSHFAGQPIFAPGVNVDNETVLGIAYRIQQDARRTRKPGPNEGLKEAITRIAGTFPNYSQEQICGRVDDLYEQRLHRDVPIPLSWARLGARGLLSAFRNPRLRRAVKTFITKAIKKYRQ